MKITRKTTLGRALEEIALTAQTLRDGTTVVDDSPLDLERIVEYHLEFGEDGPDVELEFEVKWKAATYPEGFIVQLPDGPIILQEEVWQAEKGGLGVAETDEGMEEIWAQASELLGAAMEARTG